MIESIRARRGGGRAGRRRAQTLPIVACFALVVVLQIYIASTFSGTSVRTTGKLRAQLRAIHVGQSAEARLVARLLASPWSERWFAGGPAGDQDQPLADGSYSSYVETFDAAAHLVDIYVRATCDETSVTMAWRVQHIDDSLDWNTRAPVVMFTFLPPERLVPRPGTPNLLGDLISNQIRERQLDEPGALARAAAVRRSPGLAGVLAGLGIAPNGKLADDTQPLDGTPPRPQAGYIEDAAADPQAAGEPPRPETPSPPPPPTPEPAGTPPSSAVDQAARDYPEPAQAASAWLALLRRHGIDPTNPQLTDVQTIDKARTEWTRGAAADFTKRYDAGMDGILGIVDEMENRLDGYQRSNRTEEVARMTSTLGDLSGYLELTAGRYAAEHGLPPPDPASFEPVTDIMTQGQPPKLGPYLTASAGYARWFSTVAGLGSGNIRRR